MKLVRKVSSAFEMDLTWTVLHHNPQKIGVFDVKHSNRLQINRFGANLGYIFREKEIGTDILFLDPSHREKR